MLRIFNKTVILYTRGGLNSDKGAMGIDFRFLYENGEEQPKKSCRHRKLQTVLPLWWFSGYCHCYDEIFWFSLLLFSSSITRHLKILHFSLYRVSTITMQKMYIENGNTYWCFHKRYIPYHFGLDFITLTSQMGLFRT